MSIYFINRSLLKPVLLKILGTIIPPKNLMQHVDVTFIQEIAWHASHKPRLELMRESDQAAHSSPSFVLTNLCVSVVSLTGHVCL